MKEVQGVWVDMILPRSEEDDLNVLIEHLLQGDVDAVCVGGLMSPFSEAREDVFWNVLDQAKQRLGNKLVPYIASQSFESCLVRVLKTKGMDFSCLILSAPQQELFDRKSLVWFFEEYFKNEPTLHFVIDNSRNEIKLTPEDILYLSRYDNFVASIEGRSLGEMNQLIEKLEGRLPILTNDDRSLLPFLSIGGQGVFSNVANVLSQTWPMVLDSFFNGDMDRARELFCSGRFLSDTLFEEKPIEFLRFTLEKMNILPKKVGSLNLGNHSERLVEQDSKPMRIVP